MNVGLGKQFLNGWLMSAPLSHAQFDVLYAVNCNEGTLTQREIQAITGMSLGRVNSAVIAWISR